MHSITFAALEAFPRELEKHYAAFPAEFVHWAPPSWDGVPSEAFTAIEQICHVRDIEIEGYQVRFRRTLDEDSPCCRRSTAKRGEAARLRRAGRGAGVRGVSRRARARRLRLLRGLDEAQLARPAVFEGYGPVTLRGLVHYLCSHDQQHLSGLQWLLGKIDAVSRRT